MQDDVCTKCVMGMLIFPRKMNIVFYAANLVLNSWGTCMDIFSDSRLPPY